MVTVGGSIRVLLVDDQRAVHTALGELFASLPGVELVANGYTGEDAVRLCDEHQPDVVLMDINMPDMDGITATKAILSRHPATKIIGLSGMDDADVVQGMVAVGAVGYVLKTIHPDALLSTIRNVHSGTAVFSPDLVRALLERNAAAPVSASDYGLTRRELEVLRVMRRGLNNNEVAETLNISVATVRFHITNIIAKLGAENRTEALIIATRQHLI